MQQNIKGAEHLFVKVLPKVHTLYDSLSGGSNPYSPRFRSSAPSILLLCSSGRHAISHETGKQCLQKYRKEKLKKIIKTIVN